MAKHAKLDEEKAKISQLAMLEPKCQASQAGLTRGAAFQISLSFLLRCNLKVPPNNYLYVAPIRPSLPATK